jgi:hypothetical protein
MKTIRIISSAAVLFGTAVFAGAQIVYRIQSVGTGKVLDVQGYSTALGANIQQWDYAGTANQLWMLPNVGNAAAAVENIGSGHVLDIRDWPWVEGNGVRIQQWWKHGNPERTAPTVANERWTFQVATGTQYYIVSAANNRVLTVENSSPSNGAPIVQWDNVGGAHQRWQFYEVPYTWSTPSYYPWYWNGDGNRKINNNCYNYANNRLTDSFAQPGRASGQQIGSQGEVHQRCLQDGLLATNASNPPPNGKTRIVAYTGTFFHDGQWYWDYHFWRRDNNGMWSHKPGQTDATNVDLSGNPIANPETANRGFYNSLVSYYFTPSDSTQGRGHGNVR